MTTEPVQPGQVTNAACQPTPEREAAIERAFSNHGGGAAVGRTFSADQPRRDGRTMVVKELDNIPPGEILREEFLEPVGMSQADLARATGLSTACVSEVVNGKRSVTAEVDLRLCRYFGLTDGYWLRLQAAHDLTEARRKLGGELNKITPRAA